MPDQWGKLMSAVLAVWWIAVRLASGMKGLTRALEVPNRVMKAIGARGMITGQAAMAKA